MGQYYRPLLVGTKGKIVAYSRDILGRPSDPLFGKDRYTMAKLMEHSWWENDFVGTLCRKLLNKKKHVYWVGDYCDNEDILLKAWGEGYVSHAMVLNPLSLAGLFLINHTKRIYIDGSAYFEKNKFSETWNDKEYWSAIHPLPLLTAYQNHSGGSYSGTDMKHVESWAGDLLSISEKAPKTYAAFMPCFKEQ